MPLQFVDSIWYTGVPNETGPLTDTSCTVSEVELLVLVKVTVLLWLKMSNPLLPPKSRLAGRSETCETTLPTPTPDNAAETGKSLPESRLVTDSAPRIAPLAVGWKKTLMVQLAPLDKVTGQLLLCR